MDSAYQHAQAMAQSPFFYYNPDPKSETRQHGHFTPHPHVQSQPFLQHVPPVPSTPIYSRPTSSCSQPPVPVQIFNATMQLANAPVASPRPLPQKPTILVQCRTAWRLQMQTCTFTHRPLHYRHLAALSIALPAMICSKHHWTKYHSAELNISIALKMDVKPKSNQRTWQLSIG
jgi:hypothetical protein